MTIEGQAPTSDAELNDAPITTEEAKVEIEEQEPETVTLTKEEFEKQKEQVASKVRDRAERKFKRENDALRAEFDTKFKSLEQPKPSTEGKPLLKDYIDKYESYTDGSQAYSEALNDWKLSWARKEWEAETKVTEENKRRDSLAQTHHARADKFRKEQVDYDTVMENLNDVDLPASQDVAYAIRDAIMTSDLSPQLLYYFGKNIDDLERINELSPMAAAREIGKIEAKLEKVKPNNQSSAPTPITPVTARASQNSLHDGLESEEWIKRRNAQLRKG